jgi:hypothetical protein
MLNPRNFSGAWLYIRGSPQLMNITGTGATPSRDEIEHIVEFVYLASVVRQEMQVLNFSPANTS